MTKDNEKLLVIHNFGSSAVTLPIADKLDKAIAVLGKVQEKKEENQTSLKLEKYSSVVYKLAN